MSYRLLSRPDSTGDRTGRPLSRGRKRWRRALVVLAVIVAMASALTARLFIWPPQGMPTPVSAVVMLDSPGSNLDAAVRLARQHRAAFLVISLGTPGSGYRCPADTPGETDLLQPRAGYDPGEAEFAGRLARKHHSRSIAMVVITAQASRARLRMERCFAGPVHVVTTPIALTSWSYEIAYEWGAMSKALVLQCRC